MNIDAVLESVGVGRYQITGAVLFGLVLLFSNVSPYTYVFTAGDLKYRCEIPECDSPNPVDRTYNPEWLRYAIPFRNDTGQYRKCERYVTLLEPVNGTQCVPSNFNSNMIESCDGSWVFEDAEVTIGTEFDLMCEKNKFKLSMVGTVNNIGQFIGIPISGILADYFGRKFTMIFTATASATIYIIQSFSVNYPMYLILELVASMVSSGLYTITFILAMELFLPKQRVLMYSVLECFLPFGAILVALVSERVKNWRYLLQITNIPALLFLSYFWLIEESMRWLEMQGKHDQVLETLKKIAKTNKKTLPPISLNIQTEKSNDQVENSSNSMFKTIKNTLLSPIILWRVIRCSFLWIVVTLVYYGVSINSTDIAGNKYLNFVLVSLVEIPACLLNWMIMEGLSRKMSLSSLFALCSVSCVLYKFIPNGYDYFQKFVFMVIKLGISIAFSILYILTAEIFPTSMRATMVSVCSMIGRIGSTIAPMTTLLNEYFGGDVTVLLFGLATILAAVVTTTLPESKNIKLPDTINEAEQIGVENKSQDIENLPS